jgi:hypothetical protein
LSANRKTAVVIVIALLGIVVAAGVTWGTSQLVRQRIGLASEPLTAGQRLLPPSLARTAPVHRKKATVRTTKTVTTTVPAPVTPAPTPTVATPEVEAEHAPTVTSAPKESSSPRDESQREGSDRQRSAGRDD